MPATPVNAINKATDKWLEERQEAPMDRMKNWATKQLNNASELARQLGAGPILDAANERVDTLTAGKRLLDEGGDAAELGVLAKKVACDAVAVDSDIVDRIQQVIDLYEEASTRLQTSSAGLGHLGRLAQAYSERASVYTKVMATIGQAPEAPPMTPVEWDATRFLQLRLAKAQLGIRKQVGGALADQVPTPTGGQRRSRSSNRLCLDDETSRPALQDGARSSTPPPLSQAAAAEKRAQRLEELLQELFRLQDLKGDGLLEEAEVIKLNEKIAMLHYGKDVDKGPVREKFQRLFRERLDPDGRPVQYPAFARYMRQVLSEVDTDSRAQVMILEQFIAEAESARESFNFSSFMSASDAQFMPTKQGQGAPRGPNLPTHAEEHSPYAATESSGDFLTAQASQPALQTPHSAMAPSPSNASEAAFQTPSFIDMPESRASAQGRSTPEGRTTPYGPAPRFSSGFQSIGSAASVGVPERGGGEASLPPPPPFAADPFSGERSPGVFHPAPRDSSDSSSASSGLPPSDLPMMQAPSTLRSRGHLTVDSQQASTLADRVSRDQSFTSSGSSNMSPGEAVVMDSMPADRSATHLSNSGRRQAGRLGTPAPYAVGDRVEVWSKTHQAWCQGVVQSLDKKLVNIKYTVPDGSAMVKIIPLEDEQLRLAGSTSSQAAPRRDTTPPRTPIGGSPHDTRTQGVVGDPSLEPRFLGAGGGSNYRSNMFLPDDAATQGPASGHHRSNMFPSDTSSRGGFR